jgi:predicted DCC family thiol-disulfide oxidoreductase YuxK
MATCSIPEVTPQTPVKPRPRWLENLESVYGLDARSLALFRVALAIMLLGDLWMRAQDLRAFYSDWGTLPRAVLINDFAHPWLISLHFISGQWQVEALLFILAAVFAVMMLFGWRTQLATVMSWVMLTSLHNRNPVIMQGGDTLLRMILFWAMFLPLGLTNSVDAALDTNEESTRPKRIFTVASVALILQITLMYWSAVLSKTGPEWHREGNAVWYALNLEQMATPIGRWLLHFPALLRFLTYFTLVVEASAPTFLLFPLFSGPVRAIGVLFLFFLHLGFGSCMYLGHFPFVAAVMLTAMLPAWFWEHGGGAKGMRVKKRKTDPHLKIFYDGDCGFCQKSVRILRSLLLRSNAEIAIAQNDPRANKLMLERRSWVVENEEGELFTEIRAMREQLKHSPVLWWTAPLLRYRWLERVGDRVYHRVERNRSRLSRWTSFLTYRPLRWQTHTITQVFALFCLILVIWWNVQDKRPKYTMPRALDSISLALRLDQYWDMFSPGPLRDDGWYVIEGNLKNGEKVDLFREGAPVSFERRSPAEVAGQYTDERWRKYMMNLYSAKYAIFRLHYDRYLCRKWNEDRSMIDPRLLDSFTVYYMVHETQPPGVPQQQHHRETVAQHLCWK